MFCGLDNGGKSSILLLLNKRFSLLSSIKPTFKADITSQQLSSFLGFEVANWDLGGQNQYRQTYLDNPERFFTDIQTVFYVIDIQTPERFDEAVRYLKEIVDIVMELNSEYSEFFILLHKVDPDIKKDKIIIKNLDTIQEKISSLNSKAKFSYYITSIHDDSSLIRPFSDGVISVSAKAKLIQTLLKEYTSKSFNSAAVLLDRHCFIIASRATMADYERICQEIAPRLSQAIERLEDWEINPIDIVTTIEFPVSDSDNNKEGIIFLRKLDINGERLYLIALCLNKKIKVKSYEYLPLLAENLKNLLETYK